MTRRNNIIYWISTLWLALGMASTGMVQLMNSEKEAEVMSQLNYPVYFFTIIGIWKILGVVALLIPKFPILKEWAYAGFFFVMSGAVFSHIVTGTEVEMLFGPLLLLILTMLSWYFRPADRKIILTNHN